MEDSGNSEITKFQVNEYTRLEEEETLTGCGTVFFANPQEFGVRLPWFRDC